MKLITLNTWGGRAGKQGLLAFFDKNKDADVFCLQEMWSAPYEQHQGQIVGGLAIDHSNIMVHGVQEATELLKDFRPYFRPHYGDNYGLLVMVKKNIDIIEEGELFVHKHKEYIPEGDIGNHARNIQWITINSPEGKRTVINFHGLWDNGIKTDTPDRLVQSENILAFLKKLDHPFVFCGDFNLLPDTESMKKFERTGLRNLIKENRVTSTRTSFYTKEHKFADYILVSKDIEVSRFEVMKDEVSDHYPLLLEFK